MVAWERVVAEERREAGRSKIHLEGRLGERLDVEK